mmetsp:Transcript_43672/g.48941  ORF Transcript_43672/g.48941 Transcript_43672/m.48941 type:complete len:186 (+) Transcript_43672:561-1118(+)
MRIWKGRNESRRARNSSAHRTTLLLLLLLFQMLSRITTPTKKKKEKKRILYCGKSQQQQEKSFSTTTELQLHLTLDGVQQQQQQPSNERRQEQNQIQYWKETQQIIPRDYSTMRMMMLLSIINTHKIPVGTEEIQQQLLLGRQQQHESSLTIRWSPVWPIKMLYVIMITMNKAHRVYWLSQQVYK